LIALRKTVCHGHARAATLIADETEHARSDIVQIPVFKSVTIGPDTHTHAVVSMRLGGIAGTAAGGAGDAMADYDR
jgi:hypothetical protein